MKHEKNIYIGLPNNIKFDISEQLTEMLKKLSKKIEGIEAPEKKLDALISSLSEEFSNSRAQDWFTNKAHLKDLDIIQESYDKEIKDLNEVIQRFHDKK